MVISLENLAPAEREKVSAAVAAAQARTRARFALVVVPASDRYHLYPVVWGAGLALIAAGIMALVWPRLGLRTAFAVETLVFVTASLLLEWRPLRFLIVPGRTKREHARALAHREFAARILSHSENGGGVLFFVSLGERYAEVVADRVLHAKAGQAAWDKIVADFTAAATQGRIADAFAAGADACGELLATHAPNG
jgi:putative membrane protein